MLKSIQDFFSAKKPPVTQEHSEDDLKLAAATLMFEMVKADGDVADGELEIMANSLQQQFQLQGDDFAALLELAKETSQDAISLQGFTRQICDNWNNEQRVQLVEYLWTIAFADQRIDAHERHLVRKIASLLYLNDAQIIQAKERARAQLENG